jgi:uncharacterized RDD family membrane protein YckC
MDQSGQGGPPPSGQQPPQQSPPPPQGWQSQPQQPAPPPPAGGPPPTGQPGGMGGGMPSWTSNMMAQGTIPGPGGVALADSPNRFIAALIDFIILGVVGFIINTISTSILGDNYSVLGLVLSTAKAPSLISSLVTVVIMLAISGGYFIYMWSRMGGATIGMRALKLSVRDGASGGAITQQQAINRWLLIGAPFALDYFYGWGIGIIISLAVLVWYIYLFITIAQSPTRQGFHDKYANTVVAKG